MLILVLARRTKIRVATSTMSRLLKRLGIRLGRPKPIVGCPWKKARKTRRLNQIRRLIAGLLPDEVA
ncbi:MAG: winged helix-turn-helix domain-containing protein, partial [Thermoguttaceae bacterium]|nr:winged helix-turn-helix domain-containing protein [Thermoguttaceae bacterium]